MSGTGCRRKPSLNGSTNISSRFVKAHSVVCLLSFVWLLSSQRLLVQESSTINDFNLKLIIFQNSVGKLCNRSLFCSALMSPLQPSVTLTCMCLVSHQPTSDSRADRVNHTHTHAKVARSRRWEWLAFVPHDAGLQWPSDPITLQATVVTVCLECNIISAGWTRRTAAHVGQTGSAAVSPGFISAGVLKTPCTYLNTHEENRACMYGSI